MYSCPPYTPVISSMFFVAQSIVSQALIGEASVASRRMSSLRAFSSSKIAWR